MADYMMGDPDRNSVVVPFSDDETVRDDELITEDKPTDTPQERITRREKRQARLNGLITEGKKNAERVRELEERDQKREREMAELRGMVAATNLRANQPAPPADGKDEFERELDDIYKRQSDAYTAAQAEVKAGTFNVARQRHYEGIAREIETSKADVHMRRTLARTEPVRQQNAAQQHWVNKYPDVYQNQRAFAYAQGRAQQRAAMGEQITANVVDEIMNETMTTFKIGAKPAPTQSERSKFSGSSATSSGGGGSSGITLTPELRKMALAAYDDLPEAEAIKKWTNKTGKRLRDRKVL